MTYHSLYVKNAYSLRLKNNNLIATIDEKEISMPIEDLSIILIEDNRATITTNLLSALSSSYVGIITCDDKHMPCSITMPVFMHYKQLRVFEMQMSIKKPLNSQLWGKIVSAKIRNQMAVLKQTSNDEYNYNRLLEVYKDIKSNDKTNREAIAARYHFNGVFGAMFTRRQTNEDEINSALNYGYTILMAAVTRILAMYGFNTILGIHHCSYVNNFNLSCDLMEPFRPLVDRIVYNEIDNLTYPLATDIKQKLIKVLTEKIRINSKVFLVEYAMEEMVLSYIAVLENQDASLIKLPEIIEIFNDGEADEDEL